MKKKVIGLLISAMLAVSVLSGCGDKDVNRRTEEAMNNFGEALENGDENAAMSALAELDRLNEEEEVANSSESEEAYPADPRWADVKPTELAVQLNDVFIKTGMPIGEAIEQVNNSDTFFVQMERHSGYNPDLNYEVRVGTLAHDDFYHLRIWSGYFIYIGEDKIFESELSELPGKEGDNYSLKDIPITDFQIIPGTIYDKVKNPEVYRTALGTNEDISNMSSEDVENLKDTFFAGLDVDLKSEKRSYEGINYIEYTYTVPCDFSWNGYSIKDFNIYYQFTVNYEEDRVARWRMWSDSGLNYWFAQ